MKRSVWLLLFVIIVVGSFLRLYKLSTNPPGLYIDEVVIGLDAYDILTTGKDHYGVPFPQVFKSFGDYKMPIYIYATSASMAIFGKTEFAIRFPSALAGILTLLVIFFLTKELLIIDEKTKKYAVRIALLATAILAITPWHIHFSRGGFEVNLALLFYMLGIYLFVTYWSRKKMWILISSCVFTVLSMYTYQAYRILVPLTVLLGMYVLFCDRTRWKALLFMVGTTIFISLPLIILSFLPEGQARFYSTSAFGENPYVTLGPKLFADGIIFVNNYFSYFSLNYLFRFGDQINRHQVHNLGILAIWQLPYIVAGVYWITKTKNKLIKICILGILLLGPIPASLVRPSPHTLRFLVGVIPYTLLTALGFFQFFLIKKRWVKWFFILTAVFALLEFGYYLVYYYTSYQKDALIDWGGQCKEVVLAAEKLHTTYPHIIVDKNLDCVPETYSLFAPELHVLYVEGSWRKPDSWGTGTTIYIRPFYGQVSASNLIKTIYLPNVNKDVFAQFFTL